MAHFTEGEWIWRDGEFVAWHDANIHVLSTAVQFGSSIFEGIRCYDTPVGPAIFRLDDHIRRLFDSCRMYRMDIGYTQAQIMAAYKTGQPIDEFPSDVKYLRHLNSRP